MQARSVVGGFAAAMFNRGSYTLLSNETVLIIDMDAE
jgi:hypothetical protein